LMPDLPTYQRNWPLIPFHEGTDRLMKAFLPTTQGVFPCRSQFSQGFCFALCFGACKICWLKRLFFFSFPVLRELRFLTILSFSRQGDAARPTSGQTLPFRDSSFLPRDPIVRNMICQVKFRGLFFFLDLIRFPRVVPPQVLQSWSLVCSGVEDISFFCSFVSSEGSTSCFRR